MRVVDLDVSRVNGTVEILIHREEEDGVLPAQPTAAVEVASIVTEVLGIPGVRCTSRHGMRFYFYVEYGLRDNIPWYTGTFVAMALRKAFAQARLAAVAA